MRALEINGLQELASQLGIDASDALGAESLERYQPTPQELFILANA
jgi:hypothetical protein